MIYRGKPPFKSFNFPFSLFSRQILQRLAGGFVADVGCDHAGGAPAA